MKVRHYGFMHPSCKISIQDIRTLAQRDEEPREAAIQSLTNEIRVRHYSQKTLKMYTKWVYKLRSYSQKDDPQRLTTADVKSFLTFLAVQK